MKGVIINFFFKMRLLKLSIFFETFLKVKTQRKNKSVYTECHQFVPSDRTQV